MARLATFVSLFLVLPSAAAAQGLRPGTTLVSVASSGALGDADSYVQGISRHGRFVLFHSNASNLVAGDDNGSGDLFVHDRLRRTTTLVGVNAAGAAGELGTGEGALAAGGRFVAFGSVSGDLVAGDTNGDWDVFVRDLEAGITERVSVGSLGEEGNGASYGADVSADGRYVVFGSSATNLVPDDTNGERDVFLRDRLLGTTTRVSVSAAGAEANLGAFYATISDDGSRVAFDSLSSTLVPGDVNGKADVFLVDLATGAVTLVSVSTAGLQGDDSSLNAALSEDGRFVVFPSHASNLVADDTNALGDVFLRDVLLGTTTRVSVASGGTQGTGGSLGGSISADGRLVTFRSDAADLVAGDTNGARDVFVHDVVRGLTRRINLSNAGAQGNGFSSLPFLSADGRHVAYYGAASNLVEEDTNRSWDVFVTGLRARDR